MTNQTEVARYPLPSPARQQVVIVNGNTETLELLESVLDAGHYDVAFVDSSDHAYAHIRRVQPNLVILCVRIEDVAGFQVLSMLKLDEETQHIPVLTYTTEYEGQDVDGRMDEDSDGGVSMPIVKPALRMH